MCTKLDLLLQILDFILGHSIIHYVDRYAAVFQPYHHKAQLHCIDLVCCMTLNGLHTWIHVGLYIYLSF